MKQTILKSTFFIAIAAVLLRSLGFVREMSLAAVYGAGMVTDAFVIAHTAPGTLLAFVSSSVSSVFIPIYQSSKERRDLFASNIINLIAVIGLVFSAVFAVFPQALVYIFASQLDPATFELTVMMTRIMVLVAVPVLLLNIFRSFLEIKGIFFTSHIVYAAINTCVITAIFLSRQMQYLPALGIGVVTGNFLSIILITIPVRRHGFKYRPYLNLRDESLRETLVLIAPVLIATGIGEINQIADRNFASTLPAGAISSLNYAIKLVSLATMLVGTAVATALFPKMSELASDSNLDSLKKYLMGCVTRLVPVLLPLTAGTVILAGPLVRILFERGAFTPEDTRRTAECLQMYSVCITCSSINVLLLRACHAMKNTKGPAICSSVAVAFNIALNFLLVAPLKHVGLAMATGTATAVTTILLTIVLKKRIGRLDLMSKIPEFAKALAATLLMTAAVSAGRALLPVMTGSMTQCVLLTGGLVFGGAGFYLLMHVIMRTDFLRESLQLARSMLRK